MTHHRRSAGLSIAAMLALLGVACGERAPDVAVTEATGALRSAIDRPQAPGEVRRESGLDVLLITVDTLRADALGSYGRAGAATPWMDRLARDGVRFERAYAHNVLTLPSHANILSGLHPPVHGVRDNSGFRFPDEVPTLAAVLRDHGYRTAAFVSAFPLDSRFGLAVGFELYEDSFADVTSRPAFLEQERPGHETVALALDWLAVDDPRPSFAWVHVYEPHFPYAPPEPLASRFASEPYQGDVAAADAALAPLVEPLLTAGEGSDTLVVLTSDHGESLGEHGEATHGIFAYESVLRVPLILHQPRLLEPRIVTAAVRHVDLMPTILDALEIPVPAALPGRSLLPVAVGLSTGSSTAAPGPPPVYFEALSGQLNRGWAPLYGVVADGWKYIDLPIPELYDLDRDPAESTNLAASLPDRVAEIGDVLGTFRALDPGAAPSPETAEVRRRLAALGYVGGATPGPESYSAADDPKNLIGLDEVLREVATLHAAGDLAGALERCRELVRRRPGMRVALLHLAQLEREAGDLGEAIRALEAAFALQPEDASTLTLLATYLTQAGREREAIDVTAPHAGLETPDVEVLLTRALALARLRQPEEAYSTLERAAALDPTNPKVPVYLGTFYLMGGQRERARAAYRDALALHPGTAAAHSSLAILAIEEGDVEESLASWRRAVAADPREHAKLFAIATGLDRAGRRAEAEPLLELFAASAPPGRYGDELVAVRRLLAASGRSAG